MSGTRLSDQAVALAREGIPTREIAARLGSTSGSVAAMVSRARSDGEEIPYAKPGPRGPRARLDDVSALAAFQQVGAALAPLDQESQRRILRAAAILCGVDPDAVVGSMNGRE